jgi:competence protein ComEA
VNFPDLPQFTHQQRRSLALVASVIMLLGIGYSIVGRGHGLESASAKALPKLADPIPSLSIPRIKPVLLFIDVSGKVKHPGVYSLPAGSRAIDAIRMAGNSLPKIDLSDINLAHLLVDGEQILVGQSQQNISSSSSTSSTSSSSSTSHNRTIIKRPHGPISINTADIAQLDSLPGIGPVMAGRIIAYRKQNGAFSAIDDLKKVKGMGKSKFAELKGLVRL